MYAKTDAGCDREAEHQAYIECKQEIMLAMVMSRGGCEVWTKAAVGHRPPRNEVISQRGFRRVSVCTGGMISDSLVMIADENTCDDKKRLILLDHEQAAAVVSELQRFIDSKDDFRDNCREV